jgi:hypothetical protein
MAKIKTDIAIIGSGLAVGLLLFPSPESNFEPDSHRALLSHSCSTNMELTPPSTSLDLNHSKPGATLSLALARSVFSTI